MNRQDEAVPAAPADPGQVVQWLREQSLLCEKLGALSVRQRSLVSADDAGPLLTVLAERQKLFEQLSEIGARLAPVRRNWSAFRSRLTEPQRAEADRWLNEGGRRLREVIARDEQDVRVLAGRREIVARAMKSAHATGEAILAYRAQSGRSGRLEGVVEGG